MKKATLVAGAISRLCITVKRRGAVGAGGAVITLTSRRRLFQPAFLSADTASVADLSRFEKVIISRRYLPVDI